MRVPNSHFSKAKYFTVNHKNIYWNQFGKEGDFLYEAFAEFLINLPVNRISCHSEFITSEFFFKVNVKPKGC